MKSELAATKEREDLIGKRFGKLTVLKLDNSRKIGTDRVRWICQCDCGNIISVLAKHLKSQKTVSCGCVKSTPEYLISQILKSLNITYHIHYTFKDFPKRYFDFVIFNNDNIVGVIEYDGEQHFKFVKTWHHTEENFLAAIARDEEKNEYCKQHNIKLYRIRYDEPLEERMNEILSELGLTDHLNTMSPDMIEEL